MLTNSTPNCLANTRSSAVKSPGICSEILMPGESGLRGRPPAKTGPAPRAAAPMARTKSRRPKLRSRYLIATASFRRLEWSSALKAEVFGPASTRRAHHQGQYDRVKRRQEEGDRH